MTWNGPTLRDWQRDALDTYLAKNTVDFLTVATPGAGKTTFALRVAHELLVTGTVERVVVVVPTEHLKVQWAKAAHRCGISLDPTTKNANGLENRTDYRGAALTYAQVSTQPDLHRHGCGRWRTLVILDETHHAGDEKAWGTGVQHAFGAAERRLSLSGTPFRSDNNPIPFIDYGLDGRSAADYTYGYGRAIRDDVCRQVDFHFYDGQMKWMDAGVVTSSANLSADLAEGDASAALETALDPGTGWMRGLLKHADGTLTALREEAPNAGGLVIAYRASHARAYAQALAEITGEQPTIVLSEDGPEANAAIESFDKGTGRWLVAVRMVSEGVDVPRLAVGVYATKTKTEMFFRQAVGRFVRRQPDEDHAAVVFAPALKGLRVMAAQIEQEIQHEIDLEQEEYERAMREGGATQLGFDFRVPLSASEPTFDRAIHAGQEYTPDENERAEALLKKHGFPASSLAALRRLVREDLSSPEGPVAVPAEAIAEPQPAFQYRKTLSGKLAKLNRSFATRTSTPFQYVEAEVNRAMGVTSRKDATIKQLELGVAHIKKRLSSL